MTGCGHAAECRSRSLGIYSCICGSLGRSYFTPSRMAANKTRRKRKHRFPSADRSVNTARQHAMSFQQIEIKSLAIFRIHGLSRCILRPVLYHDGKHLEPLYCERVRVILGLFTSIPSCSLMTRRKAAADDDKWNVNTKVFRSGGRWSERRGSALVDENPIILHLYFHSSANLRTHTTIPILTSANLCPFHSTQSLHFVSPALLLNDSNPVLSCLEGWQELISQL